MKKNKLLVYPATLINSINIILRKIKPDAKEYILYNSIYMMFKKVSIDWEEK